MMVKVSGALSIVAAVGKISRVISFGFPISIFPLLDYVAFPTKVIFFLDIKIHQNIKSTLSFRMKKTNLQICSLTIEYPMILALENDGSPRCILIDGASGTVGFDVPGKHVFIFLGHQELFDHYLVFLGVANELFFNYLLALTGICLVEAEPSFYFLHSASGLPTDPVHDLIRVSTFNGVFANRFVCNQGEPWISLGLK